MNGQEYEYELDSLLTEVKVKMKAYSYKLIDEAGVYTNQNDVLAFKQKRFYGATPYKVISFVEKCKKCVLNVQFIDSNQERVQFLEADLSFSTSFNIIETEFSLFMGKTGTCIVYTDTPEDHYVYSLLYFK